MVTSLSVQLLEDARATAARGRRRPTFTRGKSRLEIAAGIDQMASRTTAKATKKGHAALSNEEGSSN